MNDNYKHPCLFHYGRNKFYSMDPREENVHLLGDVDSLLNAVVQLLPQLLRLHQEGRRILLHRVPGVNVIKLFCP